MTMVFNYTVKTDKSFSDTVDAVIEETEKAGFRVLYIHDVQETLAKKGFIIEPLKIIEICNAKNAYSVLQKDMLLSLFLPCKINVYIKNNKTYIVALKPSVVQKFTQDKEIRRILKEVNLIITTIVDKAGGEFDDKKTT